jgi:diguanylate cyclase (GGDEF)-like protein
MPITLRVSFRTRLTLFFLLIVVLPMAAVAIFVSVLADNSREGKTDARLATSTDTALALYDDGLERARTDARVAARDEALADALRGGDSGAAQDAADALAAELEPTALTVLDADGKRLASAGPRDGIAAAELELRGPDGPLGSVVAAPLSAPSYAQEVKRLTGSDVAVFDEEGQVASTLGEEVSAPDADEATDVEVGGEDYRTTSVHPGGADRSLRIATLAPLEEGGLAATPPLVAGALAAFFAIAVFFVALLLRSLQGQIREMFNAAHRVGSGDFSQKVPVEGDDEMAGLATEFNRMSGRLADQMDELKRQRVELERSVQRIGEAFASGLDRRALLEIVAETALTACDAEAATVVLAERGRLEVGAGDRDAGPLGDALRSAVAASLETGESADVKGDEAVAIATPLVASGGGKPTNAVMAIARRGAAFDDNEREMLRYLGGQAAVSVENIDLHELVSEQAARDELTGLANSRRFRELVEKEAERAERFGHQLSLVLLDVDDFKKVNDTYGHLQGDEVLRVLGRILLEESRGIDEPARYGGEEFVVALPETGREGALELAERIRSRLESASIRGADGGEDLAVTTSVGVATLPDSAGDTRELIAAADAALYEAKRTGKNRTVCAPYSAEGVAAQGHAAERRT